MGIVPWEHLYIPLAALYSFDERDIQRFQRLPIYIVPNILTG
jgi:hypothetical protein